MIRVICVLIGYVFGLFQTSFFYGKRKGIDIREHGSGNAGTTNTLRVLGSKAGVIVFIGDVLKCIAAVLIVRFCIGSRYPEMNYLLAVYAGAGVILGHNFPFYLQFRGGKGIASTAGLIIALHPYLYPMGLLCFFGVFGLTHYVSLGSLTVYAGLMIETLILGQLGVFGMSQPLLNEMYLVTAFLTVMAYWKHRENIKRLMAGNERKTYLVKKNNAE